jgi:competence protein ComEA
MATFARWTRVGWALAFATLSAAPALAADTKTPAGRTKPADVRTARVDLNSATAAELQALPGIGKATAKKIIDHRPYDRKDDLVTRKIISKATYDKISDYVVVQRNAPSASPRQTPSESARGKPANP